MPETLQAKLGDSNKNGITNYDPCARSAAGFKGQVLNFVIGWGVF